MSAPDWIVCRLTPEEFAIATRPVRFKPGGAGDYQRTLLRVLSRLDHRTRRLEVLPQLVAQFRIWIEKSGGYEDRFRAILSAVDRAALGCECQQYGKSGVAAPSGLCLVCGEPVNMNGAVSR